MSHLFCQIAQSDGLAAQLPTGVGYIEQRGARRLAWAGTVASGIIGCVALGEVRGRKFADAANSCTGTTPCWAAAVVGIPTHKTHRKNLVFSLLGYIRARGAL